MIYLDNAATSFPKPAAVSAAMAGFMSGIGANPGRSGHRLAMDAARVVFGTREKIASLFGMADPLRVAFCANATEALNIPLRGLLRAGDHVITTSMEHNSVMRPLRRLVSEGVEISVAMCSREGLLDPADIEPLIKKNTKLIVINHASNVTGSIQPVAEVGAIARRHGILLLADVSQTAGAYPIHMEQDCIDLLAFTGHKNLLGPQGTGGLVIGSRVDIAKMQPLRTGGTGSRSEHEYQPEFLPDRYESGTPNAVGLAGLSAAMDYIAAKGIGHIRAHDIALTERLLNGLASIEGVTIYGAKSASAQTATVSFNIEGSAPSEVAQRLDDEYEIMCRPGLHCSPSSHKTIGTFPDGTIRFSMGYMNQLSEIDAAVEAVRAIAAQKRI